MSTNTRHLETGQVAKICNVSRKTVIKWFNSGRLRGFRIPGSLERRIPVKYLVQFLKEHGMPLGDLKDEVRAKVLVVSQDWVFVANLKQELPDHIFKVVVTDNSFDAGIEAQDMSPDCVIVDFSIGRAEALQICYSIRHNSDLVIIALLPNDGSSTSFDRSSINETFKKPFDAALLAERVRAFIGAKKELL